MSFFKTDFDKKRIDAHRINKKADFRLGMVADGFAKVLGDKCVEVKKGLLTRDIIVKDMKYIKAINLDYRKYENRFWAFSYNLDVTAEFDASEMPVHETEECRFTIKPIGKMAIKDVEWVAGRNKCTEKEEDIYVKKLNNKLLRTRMTDLDIGKAEITFDPKTCKWKVYYRSMIGSTTWVAIPPLTQLITPKEKEYAQMVECLALMFSSVMSKEMMEYKKNNPKPVKEEE